MTALRIILMIGCAYAALVIGTMLWFGSDRGWKSLEKDDE